MCGSHFTFKVNKPFQIYLGELFLSLTNYKVLHRQSIKSIVFLIQLMTHKGASHISPVSKHSPLSPCPHVSLLARQMRLACHSEEENLFQKAFREQVWESLACFCDPWHSLVLQGALFTVTQLENACHLSCIHPIFLSLCHFSCAALLI